MGTSAELVGNVSFAWKVRMKNMDEESNNSRKHLFAFAACTAKIIANKMWDLV